jgi:hypothetical protein
MQNYELCSVWIAYRKKLLSTYFFTVSKVLIKNNEPTLDWKRSAAPV